MRKLKLQMQISIDGFVQYGQNDEQHWVTWAWDEIKKYVLDLADSADTEIIGRKLAIDYIPYWLDAYTKPDDPMYEAAKIKANQKKIVFTKTLETSEWENTELAKGNLTEEVNKLKNQSGKDIIVYGGSSFVSALVKENLIDEFIISVIPILVGNGTKLFKDGRPEQKLKLVSTKQFDKGLTQLHYKRADK